MLNAVEYQIINSASDDKEAAKIRAKLYTKPRGWDAARAKQPDTDPPSAKPRKARPAMGQMTTAETLALIAAQDSGLMR